MNRSLLGAVFSPGADAGKAVRPRTGRLERFAARMLLCGLVWCLLGFGTAQNSRAGSESSARKVSLRGGTVPAGSEVIVTIELNAAGDENALGFSLGFDPAKLRFERVSPGSDAEGASLLINDAAKAAGRVGIALALPAGGAFAAGTRALARVVFTILPAAGGDAPIQFGDSPIGREIVDAGAQVLAASYVGTVIGVETGAPNSPPAVSAIGDQTAKPATQLAIPFTVEDAESAAANLGVTVVISNEGLFSPGSVRVEGTGRERVLRGLIREGAEGATDVTIRVADEAGAAATRTFRISVSAGNTPPTLSVIPDQALAIGQALEIRFTVGDAESPAGLLQIGATSAHPALLPNSRLELSGADANRLLRLSAGAGTSGVATVQLTVADPEGLSFSRQFAVRLFSNAPPVISRIADQESSGEPVGPIEFAVSDADSEPEHLMLTATSSFTTLLPTEGIVLAGSSTNRTVTLQPQPGISGSTLVTLTVTDPHGASALASFSLAVKAANQRPEISPIPRITTQEDTATPPIEILIADAETPADNLVLTAVAANPVLIPLPGIRFSGAGMQRFLTLEPAADQFGQTTIFVIVSDGQATTTAEFSFEVFAVNDRPTIAGLPTGEIAATGEMLSVPFAIADPETAAAELKVEVFSSDSALLPQSALRLDGGSASRILRISPAAGAVGVVTLTVSVTDPQGQAAAASFNVTLGSPVNQPPVVKLVSPASGDRFVPSAPIALRAQASDPDGTVAAVRFFAGGELIGERLQPPYELTWRTAVPGNHTLRAVALDNAGLAVESAGVIIAVADSSANDHFLSAAILSGRLAQWEGTNLGATRETGEPLHAGQPGGSSIWWTWTAPSSGPVSVTTAGSAIDTLLAIYTGSTVETLARIAANDDDPAGGVTSHLEFEAVSGMIYRIAVDAFGAEQGTIRLAVRQLRPTGPLLGVASSGRNLILTWQVSGVEEFVLEETASLAIGEWAPVPGAPAMAGAERSLKVGTSAPARFYRLRRN